MQRAGIDRMCFEGPCTRALKQRGVDALLAMTVESVGEGYEYGVTATNTDSGAIQHQMTEHCPTCDPDTLEKSLAISLFSILGPVRASKP